MTDRTAEGLGDALRKIALYGCPRLRQLPAAACGRGAGGQWALEIEVPAKPYEECGRPHWYFRIAHPDAPEGWSSNGWSVKSFGSSPEAAAESALEKLEALAAGPLGPFARFPDGGG